MKQTENTVIVLHTANYREADRMLTLFSPVRGRMEAIARGCRRPKSPLLNAAETFALGEAQWAILLKDLMNCSKKTADTRWYRPH